MGNFLKVGLVSALVATIINLIVYVLFRVAQGNTIELIGDNRGALYILTITFITFLASILGAVLYGFIAKQTNKVTIIYVTIAIVLAILSSVASQLLLIEEYRGMAHILHVIVPVVSIWFLSKTKQN
ncbi:hypothetical protein EJF36_01140 [Bacillus sp. HMF5848]|uniref:DUF6069 family protein n=1 Tax=Bacillus sp. HMF5848 TaxID=2495421 RepID=UPI000F789F5D|nr:DUF6069 family protein [Bacillus sp. HMF5848]RSK25625.1 hypothetical protein EJF36_01140 [Bacillus sp. HMF5848]